MYVFLFKSVCVCVCASERSLKSVVLVVDACGFMRLWLT